MSPSKYRSTNLIIQTILEGIIRADKNHTLIKEGIVKSHLIQYCGLKSVTAEKYFNKMIKAEYIEMIKEPWGDREVTKVFITPKGEQRYKWFVQINAELEN